jgi:hypothetical protein
MTDTTTEAPALAPGRCPIWCDVPDHSRLDAEAGAHLSYSTYELRRHPCGDGDHEDLIVGLEVGPGDTEPYVSIVPRCQQASCETQLTLDEAENFAAYLGVLVRKARKAIEQEDTLDRLVRALAGGELVLAPSSAAGVVSRDIPAIR